MFLPAPRRMPPAHLGVTRRDISHACVQHEHGYYCVCDEWTRADGIARAACHRILYMSININQRFFVHTTDRSLRRRVG